MLLTFALSDRWTLEFLFTDFQQPLTALGVGLSGFCLQSTALTAVTLTLSYRYEPVMVVSLIEYLTIVYAFLFDWLYFGVRFQWPKLLGTFVIIASCLYVSFKD